MPRSPGHVFYDRLQKLLAEAGFDVFVEETCEPYYARRMDAPSLPPGRYFRMHMIGYFEGLDSERGIVWRCSDSRSLGEFLRLGKRDKVPDHSWLSKTRSRLPHEVHEKVFAFVLKLVAERGLESWLRLFEQRPAEVKWIPAGFAERGALPGSARSRRAPRAHCRKPANRPPRI